MAISLGGKVKVLNVHTPPNYPYGVVDSAGIVSAQIQETMKEYESETSKILKKNIKLIKKI